MRMSVENQYRHGHNTMHLYGKLIKKQKSNQM